MDIVLANPRGFCAGVDRAIDIVNRALEVFGRPVYVRHEVVHNRHVVDDLRDRGAIFVDELAEVPDDAIVIFIEAIVFNKNQLIAFFDFDVGCLIVPPAQIFENASIR